MVATLLALSLPFAPQPVEFLSGDGNKVFGDLYGASKGKAAPSIVLLHQAGSNSSEYETIAPRLVSEGYNCLALDLRGGGTMWGRDNRTMTAIGRATPEQARINGFTDAKSGLQWLRDQGFAHKFVTWGSSYSGYAACRLAKENPDVVAMLSFSSAGGMGLWRIKEGVTVPALFTFPPNELEQAKANYEALAFPRKTLLIQIAGVHGSSTLREDRNPSGNAEIWKGVIDFLRGACPSG